MYIFQIIILDRIFIYFYWIKYIKSSWIKLIKKIDIKVVNFLKSITKQYF